MPLFTLDQAVPFQCKMIPCSPTAQTSLVDCPKQHQAEFCTAVHNGPGSAVPVRDRATSSPSYTSPLAIQTSFPPLPQTPLGQCLVGPLFHAAVYDGPGSAVPVHGNRVIIIIPTSSQTSSGPLPQTLWRFTPTPQLTLDQVVPSQCSMFEVLLAPSSPPTTQTSLVPLPKYPRGFSCCTAVHTRPDAAIPTHDCTACTNNPDIVRPVTPNTMEVFSHTAVHSGPASIPQCRMFEVVVLYPDPDLQPRRHWLRCPKHHLVGSLYRFSRWTRQCRSSE